MAHQEDLLVEGVHRDLNAAAAVDHAIAVIVVAVAGGGNVEAADVRLMLGYLNIYRCVALNLLITIRDTKY